MPSTVKDQARQVIDGLPENATWEDLMYQLYVREATEAGIRDADEGRIIDVAQVRSDYGLNP